MVSKEFNKLVIFTGLANCGKTTVINPAFKQRGYRVVSTSQILHNLIKDTAYFLFEQNMDLFSKDISYKFAMSYVTGENNFSVLRQGPEIARRYLLVHVAENIIKKNLGSKVFAERAAYEAFQAFFNNQAVVYECFYPEYRYFIEKFQSLCHLKCGEYFDIDIVNINVVAPFQIDAHDKRRLFSSSDFEYTNYERHVLLNYTNYQQSTTREACKAFSDWLDIYGL